MPGQPPALRFITKNDGDEKSIELGAAWATSNKEVFRASVNRAILQEMLDVDANSETIRFGVVVNRAKQQLRSGPQPMPKPAG